MKPSQEKNALSDLDNLKIAILGDLINGRTIHSLIKLFGLYDNIEFYGLSKENLALPEKYIKIIEETGNKYFKCNSFDDIPRDVDIMYHTRIQAERSDEDLGKEDKQQFLILLLESLTL